MYYTFYSRRTLAPGGSVTLQDAAVLLKGAIVFGRIWPEKWNFSLSVEKVRK